MEVKELKILRVIKPIVQEAEAKLKILVKENV